MTSVRPSASDAPSVFRSVKRFGAAVDDDREYSSAGRVVVDPTKAMAPFRPTATSTQNDDAGLTSPSWSFRAAPPIVCTHSDTRVPSLAPTSTEPPSGI